VNLFATKTQASQNQVVIVHELLHGFGAQDKYDLKTGQPLYPLGYAQPEKVPLYPQSELKSWVVEHHYLSRAVKCRMVYMKR
jgi:hypothetical protein